MRLVFFGTPDFAVPSLQALLTAGHDVAAVITQPDKARGRSRSRLVPPPVKTVAADLGITVLQPQKPLGDVFLQSLRHLDAELGIVVAYGHLLKPAVLATPRLGMINVHASLLPRLRGAAPIPWAILNGEPETGVSIMQMEAGLDSGPVYHRVSTPIGPEETGGELTVRLAQIGADALVQTLEALAEGRTRAEPQDAAAATFAPKVHRDLCRIRWDEPALACSRRVRAFDPDPAAWTTLHQTEVKLFGGRVQETPPPASEPAGTVIQTGARLSIATGEGALVIREVQPAGKRRMPVADWVRGRGVAVGDRFA